MTSYLLQLAKSNPTSMSDPTAFMLALKNVNKSEQEHVEIIEAFNDWEFLTPTWFMVADYLDVIGQFARNNNFPAKYSAATLASKVCYWLGDYGEALDYTLLAGDAFTLQPAPASPIVGPQDELYVKKMIEVAVDVYKTGRQHSQPVANPLLEQLVNRIFEVALQSRNFPYAIALAMDCRRIDFIKRAIEGAGEDGPEQRTQLLMFTVQRVWESQLGVAFRGKLIDLLFQLFAEMEEPDFVSMCQCLIWLEQPDQVAEILQRLLRTTEGALLAYQLAFDLYENATQQFIHKISQALDSGREPGADEGMSDDNNKEQDDAEPMDFDLREVIAMRAEQAKRKSQQSEALQRLKRILSGEETIRLHMQFLIKNNHTDMLILKRIKESVRCACTHNATLISNGLMHLGTTCDDFLRENLDWISKATNWNKFNAVASLGLIHKGHETNARKVLDPYLPKGEQDEFGFKEGGSLYAYGLIHVNHGSKKVIDYLMEQLDSASTVAVRHGACLGLGLAACGSHDEQIYSQLRQTLYDKDEAVSGEAASTAMGLVKAASLDQEAFQEMQQYVKETQHDKIQRGLRTGIALLAYGHMEKAEEWISELLGDANKSNAVLRQTGVCTIAMAYAGSGRADVIKRLLAYVANDPNNDVKRWAAIGIGFVMSNDPAECLNYAKTLSTQFNPHVRYGAAIALGISCAGTGYKEAVAVLSPLLSAKENFVRQGALIATAFVLIQQTTATCAEVSEFRATLTKMVSEKGEDSITKFGAIISQGILDAGGRNVTLSLRNRNSQSTADMSAVLGTFVFLQYWYWHSMTHFLSMAFRPTCLIGLNSELRMPKMEFRCNAKPSLFAYPAPLEEKKKDETERVEAAILSTNKAKHRGVAAVATAKEQTATAKVTTKSSGEGAKEGTPSKDESEKPKEPALAAEPGFYFASNPARVVRLQLERMQQVPEQSRYRPLKSLSQGGIILMRDLKAGDNEEEEIVELSIGGGTGSAEGSGATGADAEMPTPFEFNFGDY